MAKATAEAESKEETTSGYFRRILSENPKLRRGSSSKPVFERYLQDHPEETEVSERVRQIYYNVKSILRSRKKKRKGNRTPAETVEITTITMPVEEADTGPSELEHLEEQIDECLALAKSLDRDGLENVISNLRQARNQVVVKQGM